MHAEESPSEPPPATEALPDTARPSDAQPDEDQAHAARLLDAAAESAHDKRIAEGTAAVAAGVLLVGAGAASWITASDPDARQTRDVLGGVFVGVGGLMLLGGGCSLVSRSALEERRDDFIAATRHGAGDEALREADREIDKRAKEAKRERIASAVVSFLVGAAEIGGGIALETTTDDDGLRWLGRTLIAGGRGSGFVGAGHVVIRSEDERTAELWRKERSSLPQAPSAVKVTPRFGLGGVGVVGVF